MERRNNRYKVKLKIMNREELITSHILPYETQDTIIKYLKGEIDYDEEFITEVALANNITIKK